MKMITFTAIAALFPMAALAAGDISVDDAYARGRGPKVGAVFMTIKNGSNQDCRLISAKSDISKHTELHTHKEVDGVMKMTKLEDGLVIPAGGEHALARGGDHIMLMGLKSPLKNVHDVPLTLDFGGCGSLDLTVMVDNDRKPMKGMRHGKHAHGKHGNDKPDAKGD